MLTAMRDLDEQTTELEMMTDGNRMVEDSAYWKTMLADVRQLDQVAQTDKALQATFQKSRTNNSCTWEDVWKLMKEEGLQQETRIKAAWAASKRADRYISRVEETREHI